MSLENINEKMDKVIENLEMNFSEIRAGRANPTILNKVFSSGTRIVTIPIDIYIKTEMIISSFLDTLTFIFLTEKSILLSILAIESILSISLSSTVFLKL